MELWEQIEQKVKELDVSVKTLRKTGTELAEAERNYKEILSKKALELRDSGMAVTLIDKVIYGIKDVAELRFKRDVAEAVYNANKEAINSIKLQIKIIQEQNSQEWGAAKYDGIR